MLDAGVQALDPSGAPCRRARGSRTGRDVRAGHGCHRYLSGVPAGLGAAGDNISALRLAVARAIVAEALAKSTKMPILRSCRMRAARDQVVRLLAEDLGGQERGVPDLMVADPVRGHALRLATVRARRLRGALADAADPSAATSCWTRHAGDRHPRVHRQAGQPPRPSRSSCSPTASAGSPPWTCWPTRPLPSVRLLVTVGSQAPFLYEIGALSSPPTTTPLPAHMPRGSTSTIPDDLLSYVGAPLFPARSRTSSQQREAIPPVTHCLLGQPKVWDTIVSRLP